MLKLAQLHREVSRISYLEQKNIAGVKVISLPLARCFCFNLHLQVAFNYGISINACTSNLPTQLNVGLFFSEETGWFLINISILLSLIKAIILTL